MRTSPTDWERFKDYLRSYYPGIDVSVNMRTSKYRVLSGLWHWDMIEMEHCRRPRSDLWKILGGIEYHEYITSVKRVRINWKTVEDGLERLAKIT